MCSSFRPGQLPFNGRPGSPRPAAVHKSFASFTTTLRAEQRPSRPDILRPANARKHLMNEAEFWKLIELIDVHALDDGNEDGAIRPLRDALVEKSEEELFAFEEQLALQLYEIDGEVYADNAGDSSGSDDGFLYARCYVVAKGRKFFDAVKGDPTRMPKSIEQWCETLLYPHRQAWALLTGSDASAWPFFSSVSYESGSNADLW